MRSLDAVRESGYTKDSANNNYNWPKCFDDYQQWMEWCRLADLSYTPKSNICIDCTPEYKGKMLLAKRCEYPRAVFKTRADGELVGDCKSMPHKRKKFDYPINGLGSNDPPLVRTRPVGASPPYLEDEWQD